MIGFVEGIHMIGHLIKLAVLLGLFGAGLSIAVILGIAIATLPYFLLKELCDK